MIGFTRRAVVAGVGGTALSALVVAGWTDRDGPGRGAHRPSVRWMGLTTVAVVEATRWSAVHEGRHDHAVSDHHGGGEEHEVHAAGEHGQGAWTDTLLVDLDLRNDSDRTVRISAGQFRLRVDSALMVSYYDAQRPVTVVPAGHTVATRIAYLLPRDATSVSLDFAPVGAAEPRGLPLYPTRPQVA